MEQFDNIMLKARYLILPFCIILVLGILLLLVQACLKLAYLFGSITETSDADTDGVGDNSDNCPITSNADQSNIDGDILGDACDPDIDNDGFSNNIENKFGTDPADDSDTTSLMDKILAYSNQDDPEKNVPLMGLSGLFMLGVSLLTLRIWRLRK